MKFDGGRRVRAVVALGGAVALTLTLGSCSLVGGHNEPEAMVREFADAIDNGDATAAAALTSYPNAAAEVIGQVLDGMKAENVDYEAEPVHLPRQRVRLLHHERRLELRAGP